MLYNEIYEPTMEMHFHLSYMIAVTTLVDHKKRFNIQYEVAKF